MATVMVLKRRFAELDACVAPIEATKRYENSEYFPGDRIDGEMLLAWQVKVRNLLNNACGAGSVHYNEFVTQEAPQSYRSEYTKFRQLVSVFQAAREDYEGGYLSSVRSLVQAELFVTELEQAKELHSNGYETAAAVIAGVVLETTLRQLCDDRGLSVGKLDKMNADLAKNGAYTLLVQKRITALADIRNSAAHGHPEKFTANDVTDMLKQVEDFVTDHI